MHGTRETIFGILAPRRSTLLLVKRRVGWTT